MSFLLDTNVISEPMSPSPDRNVVHWFDSTDEDRLFLSVITFAEIRRGIELMSVGGRRTRLVSWLTDQLPLRFEGRVLSIDQAVADTWGIMMARAKETGSGLSAMDAFVAATAEVHGLILVTRNTAHFERIGISILDPWKPLP